MSDDTATIKIINLTPLPLHGAWPYAQPAPLGSLENVDCSIPLQVRRHDEDRRHDEILAGKIDLAHDLGHGQRPIICTIDLDTTIAKGVLPSTITIDAAFVRDPPGVAAPAPKLKDFLDAYQQSGGQWPYQLQVINKTERFVDAYLLGTKEEKGTEHRWGQLEPGQTLQFPAQDGQLWQFRSPLSGEMIGMIKTRSGPEHSDSYTLTDEFRKGWLKYQNQISSERFSPLRIIGERRSSTPSRDDQAFITATTVRRDLSKDVFNGLRNQVLRDVEIAGVLLRWSGANQLLSDYYGEDVADVRSLTIYADRMEVSDHLRFPRANVTIYARELAFTGIGCIDTTPLPYPARAESEYLTKDPLDPTNANAPADAEGTPTYTAEEGAKGEPAGNITLYVRCLIDEPGNTSTKRFICHGGKGQAGEAGGLKAYVAKDGYPVQYGPLPPITADNVKDFVQDKTWSIGKHCYDFRWPGEHGEVDWPDQIRGPDPAGNVLKTGHATAVTVLAYCDDAWVLAGGIAAWGERYFLPGYDFEHWLNSGGAYGDRSEDTKPNPAPRPCDGRDAYCGGWPGDGGDGGVITAALGSGQVPDIICDVDPGLPGDYTEYTPGGAPPGPNPAYAVRMTIVRKSAINSSRNPSVHFEDVSGKPGQNAPGRAYHGATVPSAPNELQYEWRDTTAKKGSVSQKNTQGDDLSWAQFAAVRAVLSYARAAYRNGFREEAAAALDPYFSLLGDKLASMSTDMRHAFASIMAMGNNLGRNLDYYGNPPGWVPRLNALSNLQILQTVREAAYGTYYVADKMLSDYEALDDARAVAQRTSDALKSELDQARTTLQTAYDQLPEAMRNLDAVQQEVVPVEDEIQQLRNRALEKTKDRIVAQRVFSAGMQILGGIAKSLPIGQPFVGLAGSALGSVSQFDWNAPDPLASARSSIDDFSTQVTNFVNNNQASVTTAVTSGLSGAASQQEALVTTLTRQLEDEVEDSKKKMDPAEKSWTEFKNTERDHLQGQITETKNAIKEIQAAKNDQEEAAANSFLKALNDQKAALDEKRLATLRKGLVEYRKQQADLEQQARKLALAENENLKKAAAVTTSSDTPPDVQKQLTEATRVSEDQKKQIEARQTTANNVMSSLQGLGDGLGEIGNGIVSLATPLSEDDPTWTRLTEQMLLDDPELHAQGMALNQKLRDILGRKKQAASELFFWQQQATTCAATIASNLGALTQLSRQRQSLDPALDSAVQGYLQETKERAKDALAQSIYWFVKSFQYENLEDVEDTFYNFDTWTDKLRSLEKPPKPAGSSEEPARDLNIVLTKDVYDDAGDQVFKAEQFKLGQRLLDQRQKRGANFKNKYQSCVLERSKAPTTAEQLQANQMLDNLKRGAVAFNFIDDFEKGSYEMDDARVLDVDLKEFGIESADPNLSLTIGIEHSGESIVSKNIAHEGRVFYAFQSGRDGVPMSWQFVYNQSVNDPESKVSKSSTVDTIADDVKSLLNPDLKDFQEYSPGLFSNYTIRITDLNDKGKKDALKAINKVVLDVIISTAS